jgi:hypothetical protein
MIFFVAKKIMRRKELLICVFLVITVNVFAGDWRPPDTAFTVLRVTGKMNLDGIPDEADWQRMPSLQFFVLDPVWGAAPVERTEMRFLYDENYLYVAGKCFYKDPSKIIARNFVRDGWRGDDWVAVHIDSRFDHQTAINFAIYPAGSRYDMLISNDAVELGSSPTNPSFNAVWDARSAITKEGWFFEMKIPLHNLRYKIAPDGSVQMAISVTRWTAYNNELQHSVKIPQGVSGGFLRPSLKQEAKFSGLRKHKQLLLTPYIAATNTENNLYNEDLKKITTDRSTHLTAGLDAKIGLNQRLTLDATINPDFGQAEADIQQLNLSRFGLYLPERRLFFQEQSGLFDFGLGNTTQLFYSRRIGLSDDGVIPLYGGLRVTGQLSNKMDIGLLNMQSAKKQFPDTAIVKSENYGVLRVRNKVLNDRSFVGLQFTNRNSSAASNYAVGTDAVLNFYKNNYLKIGIAATQTRDSSGNTPLSASSSRISLAWENLEQKGWIPKFSYTYSGKDFDPQLGFLDRTDFHNIQLRLAYGVFAKSAKQLFSQQKFIFNSSGYINASTGKTETITTNFDWSSYTVEGASLNANGTYNYEYVKDSLEFGNDVVIQSGAYRFPAVSFLLQPPSASKFGVPVGFGAGGFFGGQRYFLSIGPNFNSARKIHIQPGYDYTYLHFPQNNNNKNTHIHIARLKIMYAPNLHFSAAANVQYNSAEEKVFFNSRLRYNFADGHDLYLVWNNDSRTNRYLNGAKTPITEQQQFLIKYYYMFSFTKKNSP